MRVIEEKQIKIYHNTRKISNFGTSQLSVTHKPISSRYINKLIIKITSKRINCLPTYSTILGLRSI